MKSNNLMNHKKLLKEWNYEKNYDLTPDNIMVNSHKKVWWKCDKGHEWEAAVYARNNGSGCPFCSNQKVLTGYNDFASLRPDLLLEWDYEKNIINPTEISKGSSKKVWWKCNTCKNNYETSVAKRNLGQGCPYCSGKKIKIGYNDFETWCKNNNRTDLILEFDTMKNSFTMNEITVGSGKKVWWKCPNGHSYETSLHHRVNMGTGCGICSHKVFQRNENDLLTTHPEIAKEWDYEKNKVSPEDVMAGSNNKKYWFICPKGHSYNATLLNRKKGRNCPKCSIERHTSFPEKTIFYYMKKYLKNVEESYHSPILGTKEIDIFLLDYNVGIEYDGRAWHKNNKRDLEKDNECKINNIDLIRIREKGSIEYESTSIKKYITHDNLNELHDAIEYIFDYLTKKYNLNINPDINIERDRIKIMELMNLYEKNNSLAKHCPSIYDYWDYEKNGIITPEQISHSSVKKIFIKCPKGHERETTARDFARLNTEKCPVCAGFEILKGFNDLFTTNPELKSIWSSKNELDPYKLSTGSNKVAQWSCPKCGFDYEMRILDKTRGRGCPYCSSHRFKKGVNDFKTRYPEMAKEWSEKNEISPDEIFPSSKHKVLWICPKGHEYEKRVIDRIKGRHCPKCSKKSNS